MKTPYEAPVSAAEADKYGRVDAARMDRFGDALNPGRVATWAKDVADAGAVAALPDAEAEHVRDHVNRAWRRVTAAWESTPRGTRKAAALHLVKDALWTLHRRLLPEAEPGVDRGAVWGAGKHLSLVVRAAGLRILPNASAVDKVEEAALLVATNIGTPVESPVATSSESQP